MNVIITPKVLFKYLCVTIIMLVGLSVIGDVIRLNSEFASRTYVNGLLNLVDLDLEANLPSFFSSSILLFAAFLLFWISREQKKRSNGYYRWMGLAILFAFLSVDEISEIHEHLIFILRRMFHFTGFLFYAWVIPYGIAVMSVVFVYVKFLAKLPVKTRNGILLSGLIFVTGAIGFEMISAKIAEHQGVQNGPYYFIITIEESLEMFGVAYFIYTLLKYIDESFDGLAILIGGKK